jgi:hypothetical protein
MSVIQKLILENLENFEFYTLGGDLRLNLLIYSLLAGE